jgi:hypothetical protein
MKKIFPYFLLMITLSCAQKSDPALIEGKMYMHGKTYIFDHISISNLADDNNAFVEVMVNDGDLRPMIYLLIFDNQPGTYPICDTCYYTPGYAHLSVHWNTEFSQESFRNNSVWVPNDSNFITLEHCSPFKISGSFQTYIDSTHWSTYSGTYLATGTFNFEAQ